MSTHSTASVNPATAGSLLINDPTAETNSSTSPASPDWDDFDDEDVVHPAVVPADDLSDKLSDAVVRYINTRGARATDDPDIIDKITWVPSNTPWDPYFRAYIPSGPLMLEFFGTLGDSTCGDKRGPYGNNDYKGTDARTYKAQKFQLGVVPFPALTEEAAALQDRENAFLSCVEQTFINQENVGDEGMEVGGFSRDAKNGTPYITAWHYMFRVAKGGTSSPKKSLEEMKAQLKAPGTPTAVEAGTLASLPDPKGHYKKLPLAVRRTRLANSRIWTAEQRLVNPVTYREELPTGTPVMMSGHLMGRVIRRPGESTKFFFGVIMHAIRAIDGNSTLSPEYLSVGEPKQLNGLKRTAPVQEAPGVPLPDVGEGNPAEPESAVSIDGGVAKKTKAKKPRQGGRKDKEDMEIDQE